MGVEAVSAVNGVGLVKLMGRTTATPFTHMALKVANGVVLPCTSEIKDFPW
jgi:hypothetical protein